MAWLFDDADSEYLERSDTCGITGYPFVLAAWVYPDAADNCGVLSFCGLSTNYLHELRLRDPPDTDVIASSSEPIAKYAATSTSYVINTWNHVAALFVADDDRRVLLNNAGKGTNTSDSVSWAEVGAVKTQVGRAKWSSPHDFSGLIADAAGWDLSDWPGATAADKATEFERLALPALAARHSPRCFPLGLVAHWELLEESGSTAYDRVGHYDLTAYNGPTPGQDHPGGLLFPSAAVWVPAGAAAPPAGKTPWHLLQGAA